MECKCKYSHYLVELKNGDIHNADACNKCKKVILLGKVASIAGWSLKIEWKEVELKQSGTFQPKLYKIEL
jgi:hypothetical protein